MGAGKINLPLASETAEIGTMLESGDITRTTAKRLIKHYSLMANGCEERESFRKSFGFEMKQEKVLR